MGTHVGTVRAASPEQDYILNCMGCHQADGAGVPGHVPALVGVDRFLATAEGRSYIIRVPGVADVGLCDARLAALLNWTFSRFGKSAFRPYTQEEVTRSRRLPLANAVVTRGRIVSALEESASR